MQMGEKSCGGRRRLPLDSGFLKEVFLKATVSCSLRAPSARCFLAGQSVCGTTYRSRSFIRVIRLELRDQPILLSFVLVEAVEVDPQPWWWCGVTSSQPPVSLQFHYTILPGLTVKRDIHKNRRVPYSGGWHRIKCRTILSYQIFESLPERFSQFWCFFFQFFFLFLKFLPYQGLPLFNFFFSIRPDFDPDVL